MADVFISFSHEDADVASRLAVELQREGISVFKDREILLSGEESSHQIARIVETAKVIIVLLSANSRRSKFVHREVTSALERGDHARVIPVLLDAQAKNNWVWPLVSDRVPIVLAEDLNDMHAVITAAHHILHPPELNQMPSRFSWVEVVVVVLGGAMAIWLAFAGGSALVLEPRLSFKTGFLLACIALFVVNLVFIVSRALRK